MCHSSVYHSESAFLFEKIQLITCDMCSTNHMLFHLTQARQTQDKRRYSARTLYTIRWYSIRKNESLSFAQISCSIRPKPAVGPRARDRSIMSSCSLMLYFAWCECNCLQVSAHLNITPCAQCPQMTLAEYAVYLNTHADPLRAHTYAYTPKCFLYIR